jgi:hypothetical protein
MDSSRSGAVEGPGGVSPGAGRAGFRTRARPLAMIRGGAQFDRPTPGPTLRTGLPEAERRWRTPNSNVADRRSGSPCPDMDHIDRSLVAGIAWTGLAKWSIQLLSWATTLIHGEALDPRRLRPRRARAGLHRLVALINEMGLGQRRVSPSATCRGEHIARSTRSRCSSAWGLRRVVARWPFRWGSSSPRPTWRPCSWS